MTQVADHVLIKIIKEIYKISKGSYRNEVGLIAKIAAIYRSFTAKNILDKNKGKKPPKDSKLSDDLKIIKRLENDIDIAIIKLKSNSSVDSELNDLSILQNMVEISKLISKVSVNVKGLNKVIGKAAIAFANVSVTTGGGANVIRGAADQQKDKVNASSLSKAIQFNLNEATGSVDFTLPLPPISKEHEQKRNAAYAESVNNLITKKH